MMLAPARPAPIGWHPTIASIPTIAVVAGRAGGALLGTGAQVTTRVTGMARDEAATGRTVHGRGR